MSDTQETENTLITLTADIVAAHVSNTMSPWKISRDSLRTFLAR